MHTNKRNRHAVVPVSAAVGIDAVGFLTRQVSSWHADAAPSGAF